MVNFDSVHQVSSISDFDFTRPQTSHATPPAPPSTCSARHQPKQKKNIPAKISPFHFSSCASHVATTNLRAHKLIAARPRLTNKKYRV
jgi:hypothetical protein